MVSVTPLVAVVAAGLVGAALLVRRWRSAARRLVVGVFRVRRWWRSTGRGAAGQFGIRQRHVYRAGRDDGGSSRVYGEETGEFSVPGPDTASAPSVTLRPNGVDPLDHPGLVVDPAYTRIEVLKQGAGRFLVRYGGGMGDPGYLVVSGGGVRDLVAATVEDGPVPDWQVEGDAPGWFPEYEVPAVTCDRCGVDVPGTEVRAPDNHPDGDRDGEFCADCWPTVADEWEPTPGG